MLGCKFIAVLIAIGINNDTPREVNAYQCKLEMKFELKDTKEQVYISDVFIEDNQLYIYEKVQ